MDRPERDLLATKDELCQLYRKLSTITGELGTVRKAGRHAQGWTYATYSDVAFAVGEQLAKHRVAIIPTMTGTTRETSGNGVLATATFDFVIADAETGASFTVRWTGEAYDAGTKDKAIQKAATSAQKYLLMRLFLIGSEDPTDDPDSGHVTGKSGRREEEKPTRPLSPQKVKDSIARVAASTPMGNTSASPELAGEAWDRLQALVPSVQDARNICAWLLDGITRPEDMTCGQATGLARWADPATGDVAQKEAEAIAKQVEKERSDG